MLRKSIMSSFNQLHQRTNYCFRSTASTHELLPRSNMVTNIVAEVGTALEMVQWQPFDFSGVGHFSVRRSLGEALLVGEKTGRDNAARLSTSARPELKWTPLTMQ